MEAFIMNRLDNKVAIITGGTSSVGAANMLLFFASDESRAITAKAIATNFGSTLQASLCS